MRAICRQPQQPHSRYSNSSRQPNIISFGNKAWLPPVFPQMRQARSVTIAGFTLVTDTQYPDYIGSCVVSVKRQVPGSTMGNYEFPAMQVHAPADLRVACKHGYRRANLFQGAVGGVRRGVQQKVDDSIEIVERLRRID